MRHTTTRFAALAALALAAAACPTESPTPAPGTTTFEVTVLNADNSPAAGVPVTVAQEPLDTDAAGVALFTDLPANTPLVVVARPQGQIAVVRTLSGAPGETARVTLTIPAVEAKPVSGDSVEFEGLTVSTAGASFTLPDGTPYTGEVELRLATLDGDAADSIPALSEGSTATVQAQFILSAYGVGDEEILLQPASPLPFELDLSLAANVASEVNSGAQVLTMRRFDEEKGAWVPAGRPTYTATDTGGTLTGVFYHFTPFVVMTGTTTVFLMFGPDVFTYDAYADGVWSNSTTSPDLDQRGFLNFNVGDTLALYTGQSGSPNAWYFQDPDFHNEPNNPLGKWQCAGTAGDRLEHFLDAAPGLGTDSGGTVNGCGDAPAADEYLKQVQHVIALGQPPADLIGRTVCGLFFDGAPSVNAPLTDLTGAVRGLLAFEATGTVQQTGSYDLLEVKVVDPSACDFASVSGPVTCSNTTAVNETFDGPDFQPFFNVLQYGSTSTFSNGGVEVIQGPELDQAAQLTLGAACPNSTGERYRFSGPLDLTLDFACAKPVDACQVDVQVFDPMSSDGFRVFAELQTDTSGVTTYASAGIETYAGGPSSAPLLVSPPPAFSWSQDSGFKVTYDPSTGQVDLTMTDSDGEAHMLTASSPAVTEYVVTVNTNGNAYAEGEPTARLSNLTTNLALEEEPDNGICRCKGSCSSPCASNENCVNGQCVSACGSAPVCPDDTCFDPNNDPNRCGWTDCDTPGTGSVCGADQYCENGLCLDNPFGPDPYCNPLAVPGEPGSCEANGQPDTFCFAQDSSIGPDNVSVAGFFCSGQLPDVTTPGGNCGPDANGNAPVCGQGLLCAPEDVFGPNCAFEACCTELCDTGNGVCSDAEQSCLPIDLTEDPQGVAQHVGVCRVPAPTCPACRETGGCPDGEGLSECSSPAGACNATVSNCQACANDGACLSGFAQLNATTGVCECQPAPGDGCPYCFNDGYCPAGTDMSTCEGADGICNSSAQACSVCGSGPCDTNFGAFGATGGTCTCDQLPCPPGLVGCGFDCIDPNTSRTHCGATADCIGQNAGDYCNIGSSCQSGQCACDPGYIACNGNCINPNEDPYFCGATDCAAGNSGSVCGAGEVCNQGACSNACSPGLVACAGACIDPLTNMSYCGAQGDCDLSMLIDPNDPSQGVEGGFTCSPQAYETCVAGVCQLACSEYGRVECGGACIDPNTDLNFCGAQGDCQGNQAGATCGAFETCVAGVCQFACPNGLVECGGSCIDPSSDPNFCGAQADCLNANAGASCNVAGGQMCIGGACQCPSGLLYCDIDTGGGSVEQLCVDPKVEPQFCGFDACVDSTGKEPCLAGEVCEPDINGVGQCGSGCPTAGEVSCGGTCIDPLTNMSYCGAQAGCQQATTCLPSTETCVAGVCETVCTDATVATDCGENAVCEASNSVCECITAVNIIEAPNGQCIDTYTDENYCGFDAIPKIDTGEVCGAAEECVEGTCQCLAGLVDCGSGCVEEASIAPLLACDGQCIDTATDPDYCGYLDCTNEGSMGSGEQCDTTSEDCVSGQCQCKAGLLDCSGSCVDPQTDPNYCGFLDCNNNLGFGQVCTGEQQCVGGVCQLP